MDSKKKEVLTLAVLIAILPPIWAVASPYLGNTVGPIALIAAGIYGTNGNKFEDVELENFEMPEEVSTHLGPCREALLEAVAETSEEFMDRYFDGDEFTLDEIIDGLITADQAAKLSQESGI